MRIDRQPGGVLLYTIHHSAGELPSVTVRDLQNAYGLVGLPPLHPDEPRCFHFNNGDGSTTRLQLFDPDACSWAAALEESYGLQSTYALAVLCRLLALVNLLKDAQWTADLVDRQRGSLKVGRALLAVAASIPLSANVSFDMAAFERRVTPPGSSTNTVQDRKCCRR